MEKRLIVICEGGAHTVEYLHRNRVFPNSVVLTPAKFKEMMPYLTKNDDILLIIKGLTDFSLAEVYALLNDFETTLEKVFDITVLSNVDLGVIKAPYYFYQGDLFYGKVYKMFKGKKTEISTDEDLPYKKKVKKDKKSKSNTLDEKPTQKHSINAVISRYKEYNKKDVKLMIYGNENKSLSVNSYIDSLAEKIVNVDLFQNK